MNQKKTTHAETSSYASQYTNPKWQKCRLEALNRAGFSCSICHDTKTQLHVHHINYERGKDVWDYQNKNFVVLCNQCHEEVHAAITVSMKEVRSALSCSSEIEQKKDDIIRAARSVLGVEVADSVLIQARDPELNERHLSISGRGVVGIGNNMIIGEYYIDVMLFDYSIIRYRFVGYEHPIRELLVRWFHDVEIGGESLYKFSISYSNGKYEIDMIDGVPDISVDLSVENKQMGVRH
jgi:hypothetical protein